MSCILRASGKNFDVEQFVNDCSVKPIAIWHKGDPRFPKSNPDGKRHEDSGANFEISSADFSELEIQIEDARIFFKENEDIVCRLRNFPGVESVTADFGAEIHPPGWYCFTFPSDLLVLIGRLGVEISLSVYPVNGEDETET